MFLDEKKKDSVRIWGVYDLTAYIKRLLEGDISLYNFWIRGEVVDFKRAYSGHLYFSLKDERALIPCVMFKNRADRVNFDVADGMKIMARGNITLYEKGGRYQILVEELKPAGMGEMFLQFLQLKEKLEGLGYFDPRRKKSLPSMPAGVGIATTLRGAGLQDMLRTIRFRFPPINIYVSPTVVQGREAPVSIAESIRILDDFESVNVIIVGRGGGSFEDLACFNDEIVARAVYNCKKPIISGVGHETDFTICDMVADFRAATPTAAAAAAVPDLRDLAGNMKQKKARLVNRLLSVVKNCETRLRSIGFEKMRRRIRDFIVGRRQDLDGVWEEINRTLDLKMKDDYVNLTHMGEKLEALSPLRVLERGYAIVREKADGSYISRAQNSRVGSNVDLVFADGVVEAEITGQATAGDEFRGI